MMADIVVYIGIFPQASNLKKSNMIDLILVVGDSLHFHKENFARNREDYSKFAQRYVDFNSIVRLQRNFGGKMWYNPYVSFNLGGKNVSIKYGIIDRVDFMDDLLNWSSFYAAGRLQKPVKKLLLKTAADIEEAIKENRTRACALSILLLSGEMRHTNNNNSDAVFKFSEMEIFETITGLSYLGDFRVESPTKVKDIVEGSLKYFKLVYEPLFVKRLGLINGNNNSSWTMQKNNVERLIQDVFPNDLREKLNLSTRNHHPPGNGGDVSAIRNSLAGIIRKSSFQQAIKGVVTSGFLKSLNYALAKTKKAFLLV